MPRRRPTNFRPGTPGYSPKRFRRQPATTVGPVAKSFGLFEKLEPRCHLAGQTFTGEGPVSPITVTHAVSADFNGDGNGDLSTSSSSAAGVFVALGDGAGNFGAPTALGVPTSFGLAAGDFNGDGKADLASLNFTSPFDSGVSVALGNGDGTFASPVTVGLGGGYGTSVTVGDFNKDNRADLLVTVPAYSASPPLNVASHVAVLLGNANGTFTLKTTAFAKQANAVTAADFNADGKLDFASANTTAANNLSVSFGNGDGTFAAAANSTVGSGVGVDIVSGRFNNDTKADVGLLLADGTVAPLLGSGLGTFAAAATVATGESPQSLAAADFDADGKTDMVVVSGVSGLVTLRGSGTGAFITTRRALAVTAGVAALGDFIAADTRSGLAVTLPSVGRVIVTAADASGNLAPLPAGPVPAAVIRDSVSLDYNGDGVIDLAYVTDTTLTVAFGTGNGNFAAATVLFNQPGVLFKGVATGDFNRDNKADLTFVGQTTNGEGLVLVYLNGNGYRSIITGLQFPPVAVVVGDFYHDGQDHIASLASNGYTLICRNQNGFFSGGVNNMNTAADSRDLVAGDFNGDGYTDLVSFSGNGALHVQIADQYIGGYFTPKQAIDTGMSAGYDLAAGKIDDDDTLDLVVAGGDKTAVLLNVGNLVTFARATALTANDARKVALVDVDYDGKNDVILAENSGAASVRIGNGNGTFAAAATVLPLAANPVGLTVNDFNGDGHVDVFAANGVGAATAVSLNRKPTVVETPFSRLSVSGGTLGLNDTSVEPQDTYRLLVTIRESNGLFTITRQAVNSLLPNRVYERLTDVLTSAAITKLSVGHATVTFESDLSLGGVSRSLTVENDTYANFRTTQRLSSLTVNGTAALAAGGTKVLRTNALAVGTSGQLDLNDNALILDYTGTDPTDAVRSLINRGRDGGRWTGTGVVSTSAKNNAAKSTTLGYLTSAAYKSLYGTTAAFAGQAVDDTAVLIKYALYGDSDLDGGVSINDFNRLSGGFGATNKSWLDGDYDYDGGVSINDFNLLAANFGKTLTPAAATPQARKTLSLVKKSRTTSI